VRAEHLDLCNLHLWLHLQPQKSRDRTPAASQFPPQHPANTQRAKCEFCHRFYLRRRLGQHRNFSRIMWACVPASHLPRQGNPSSSASRIFSPAGDRLPENRSLSPERIPRPNGINFASQPVNLGWGSAELGVSRESVGIRARLPYFKSLGANTTLHALIEAAPPQANLLV
jgi:hypothetical protein